MKIPFKERTITTIIVIPSAIIVIALGVLQYRWSTRISEATAVRLADSLQMSLMNWQKDFFRYFSEIGQALRIDPIEDPHGDVQQYVRRLAEWRAVAKYPDLISAVHLVKADSGPNSRALVLDSTKRHFDQEQLPEELEPLLTDLKAIANKNGIRRSSGADAPAPESAYVSSGFGNVSGGWWFDPDLPALVHPIVLDPEGSQAPSISVDWMVIALNQEEIQKRILPELSQTYFQGTDGLDYEVAILSLTAPDHLLYTSDRGFGNPEPTDSDGTIDIFGRIRDRALSSPVHIFHMPTAEKGPSPLVRISWFPLVRPISEALDWRVIVRHRRGGPLGAFVEEIRRRDLAIGFGVLLVLVVNMGMLIATSHRAQRLAQLQMTFVTAVSHELRTPLTVIISGADNIRNGLVDTKQQMVQYGGVIANQARQLVGLVERILLFAATREGHHTYNLIPVDIGEAIHSVLADVAGLIQESRFQVDCSIQPNLPKVVADVAALNQCLQNLITNAVKYGANQRWLSIDAAVENSPSGDTVRVQVADHGIGISSEDLPHIFEPFYRSATVRNSQIRGTGLGLTLSKTLAEAMNGALTATSEPGHGSRFTLSLLSAPAVALKADA